MKLQKLQQKNIATLVRWLNDPDHNRFFNTKKLTIKQFKEKIKGTINYKVIYNNKMIGWVGLFELNNCGHITILINKKFQGRGLGKKALKLLIAKAQKRGLSKLKAEVFIDNKKAIGLYQSLGFKQTTINMEKRLKNDEKQI